MWMLYRLLLLCLVTSGGLSTVAASSLHSEASLGSSSATSQVVAARPAPGDDGASLDLDDSAYSVADTGGSTWRAQFEEEKAQKLAEMQREKQEERQMEEETKMLDIYEKESRVRDRALHMLANQKRAAKQVYEKQRLGEHPRQHKTIRGQQQIPRAIVRRHNAEQNQWWGGAPSYFTRSQKQRGDGDGDDVPDSDSGRDLEDIFQDEVDSDSGPRSMGDATDSNEDADLAGDADRSEESRVEQQQSDDDVSKAYNRESDETAEDSHGGDSQESTEDSTGSDEIGQRASSVDGVSESTDVDSNADAHDSGDDNQVEAGDAGNAPNDVQSEGDASESNDLPIHAQTHPSSGSISHTYGS